MEKCFFKENFKWICEKILCCENTGTGCPEKCWLLLCWKYPSLGLPEPWITCVQQEVEPDALQRILTNWTFPSLSDPISKASRFLSFNLEVRLSFRKKRKGRKNNEKKKVIPWKWKRKEWRKTWKQNKNAWFSDILPSQYGKYWLKIAILKHPFPHWFQYLLL